MYHFKSPLQKSSKADANQIVPAKGPRAFSTASGYLAEFRFGF